MKKKILLAFFVCSLPATTLAAPIGDIGITSVSAYYSSGSWDWYSGYDISFQNQNLIIDIDIQLNGVDPGDALRDTWKQGIESKWGNPFDISDGTFIYDLDFNVNWTNISPDHIVNVNNGGGYFSVYDWDISVSPSLQPTLAAHEAGHTFGLWDEYIGGPVDPVNPVIRDDSLMGIYLTKTHPDHYTNFTDWLASESGKSITVVPNLGDHYYDISAVPEPSAYLMFGSGLIGLGLMGWRRRSTKS